MRVEHRTLSWISMLLLLAGVLCDPWRVTYGQQRVCAVTGSSVVILCSFRLPHNRRVTRVMWGHVRPRRLKGRVVFDGSSRRVAAGFQYIGDKQQRCSLKIHQVKQNDAGNYMITFNSNRIEAGRGPVGPTLQVVDLKVLVSKPNGTGSIREGDSVNLTCENKCDVGDLSSAFTWFKDGQPVNEGRVLSLTNVSCGNSGNYSCSLKTQEGTMSGVITMDVEYGPKNTSVSVRPVTEDHAGGSITLVCSSRSNPPAENYTWYQISGEVLEVGHQQVLIPGERGQFLCSVTNKHGTQNSSAVTLTFKSSFFSYVLLPVAAVALLLIVTTVITVRRIKKRSKRAQKVDDGKNTQNQLEEKDPGEKETPEPVYVSFHFSSTRQTNVGRQSNSGGEVIYSTVFQKHQPGQIQISLK